jgi:large subunit ribosomal protein L13
VRNERRRRGAGKARCQGCDDPPGQDEAGLHAHADTGDFVIVVNADKVKLTGAKLCKDYQKHSNFPGGLRVMNAKAMLEKKPEEVIYQAVKGMLPKNTLGRKILKKL